MSSSPRLDLQAFPQPLIIGLAGGSGSGKTTIAKALLNRLDNVAMLLSMDSYYKNLEHLGLEERAKTNFDHPSAFETSLLVRHLEELKAGRSVDVPVYDFDTHLRRSGEVVRMYPPRVIILEGILLFVEPALRDVIDVKVFVDANADVRFIRRLRRDIAERGRSAEQVCVQYLESVRAMHSAFVEPSKAAADLIIPNDRDSAECYGAAVDALVSHAHAYSQSPKRIKLQ